ncbi:MAG TPA: tyrosine-type recombinase/integrase [Vicinamibacteria bacterium]|nr:tyrosine-type recombinase/integrase [Vicinamibacteria bacterium]
MSFEERNRFLEEARNTRHGVLFGLLLKTGLRPSEAYALRIDDLDLRTRTLRVERSLGLATREIKSTKTAETENGRPFT